MPVIVKQSGGGGIKYDPLPEQITNLVGTSGYRQVSFTWTNPTTYFAGLIIVYKTGSYPNSPNDGTVGYRGNGTSTIVTTPSGDVQYYFRAFSFNSKYQYQQSIGTNLATATPSRYTTRTIQIDQSNSDPATCCSYVGNHPAAGSSEWDTFFNERPCLFKDGAVVGYLNPNNFAQFVDGTSADITSGNAGDVMIEFPRCGLNISTSGSVVTISMTDNPNDSNFSYMAHTRGTVAKNNFYLGAYKGYTLSSKLRSLSGKSPTMYQTIGAFRTLSQANGTGYDQHAFYQLTYIQAMYVLKYANLNSQSIIGMGYIGGTSFTTTGNTNTSGMTYGITSTTQQMKLFGVEDFWGNAFDFIDGIYCDPSWNILTTTTSFNDTGSGYTNQGSGGTADVSGFMSVAQGSTTNGFIIKSKGGSGSTYYCNYCLLYADRLAVFGAQAGSINIGIGVFGLRVSRPVSDAGAGLGARLMYL